MRRPIEVADQGTTTTTSAAAPSVPQTAVIPPIASRHIRALKPKDQKIYNFIYELQRTVAPGKISYETAVNRVHDKFYRRKSIEKAESALRRIDRFAALRAREANIKSLAVDPRNISSTTSAATRPDYDEKRTTLQTFSSLRKAAATYSLPVTYNAIHKESSYNPDGTPISYGDLPEGAYDIRVIRAMVRGLKGADGAYIKKPMFSRTLMQHRNIYTSTGIVEYALTESSSEQLQAFLDRLQSNVSPKTPINSSEINLPDYNASIMNATMTLTDVANLINEMIAVEYAAGHKIIKVSFAVRNTAKQELPQYATIPVFRGTDGAFTCGLEAIGTHELDEYLQGVSHDINSGESQAGSDISLHFPPTGDGDNADNLYTTKAGSETSHKYIAGIVPKKFRFVYELPKPTQHTRNDEHVRILDDDQQEFHVQAEAARSSRRINGLSPQMKILFESDLEDPSDPTIIYRNVDFSDSGYCLFVTVASVTQRSWKELVKECGSPAPNSIDMYTYVNKLAIIVERDIHIHSLDNASVQRRLEYSSTTSFGKTIDLIRIQDSAIVDGHRDVFDHVLLMLHTQQAVAPTYAGETTIFISWDLETVGDVNAVCRAYALNVFTYKPRESYRGDDPMFDNTHDMHRLLCFNRHEGECGTWHRMMNDDGVFNKDLIGCAEVFLDGNLNALQYLVPYIRDVISKVRKNNKFPRIVLVGYNTSRFDNFVLVPYLREHGFAPNVGIFGGSILAVDIRIDDVPVSVWDLNRHMPGSLAFNCASFAIPVEASKTTLDHGMIQLIYDLDLSLEERSRKCYETFSDVLQKYETTITNYCRLDVVSVAMLHASYKSSIESLLNHHMIQKYGASLVMMSYYANMWNDALERELRNIDDERKHIAYRSEHALIDDEVVDDPYDDASHIDTLTLSENEVLADDDESHPVDTDEVGYYTDDDDENRPTDPTEALDAAIPEINSGIDVLPLDYRPTDQCTNIKFDLRKLHRFDPCIEGYATFASFASAMFELLTALNGIELVKGFDYDVSQTLREHLCLAGRSEARSGIYEDDSYICIDVVSLYPWAMTSNETAFAVAHRETPSEAVMQASTYKPEIWNQRDAVITKHDRMARAYHFAAKEINEQRAQANLPTLDLHYVPRGPRQVRTRYTTEYVSRCADTDVAQRRPVEHMKAGIWRVQVKSQSKGKILPQRTNTGCHYSTKYDCETWALAATPDLESLRTAGADFVVHDGIVFQDTTTDLYKEFIDIAMTMKSHQDVLLEDRLRPASERLFPNEKYSKGMRAASKLFMNILSGKEIMRMHTNRRKLYTNQDHIDADVAMFRIQRAEMEHQARTAYNAGKLERYHEICRKLSFIPSIVGEPIRLAENLFVATWKAIPTKSKSSHINGYHIYSTARWLMNRVYTAIGFDDYVLTETDSVMMPIRYLNRLNSLKMRDGRPLLFANTLNKRGYSDIMDETFVLPDSPDATKQLGQLEPELEDLDAWICSTFAIDMSQIAMHKFTFRSVDSRSFGTYLHIDGACTGWTGPHVLAVGKKMYVYYMAQRDRVSGDIIKRVPLKKKFKGLSFFNPKTGQGDMVLTLPSSIEQVVVPPAYTPAQRDHYLDEMREILDLYKQIKATPNIDLQRRFAQLVFEGHPIGPGQLAHGLTYEDLFALYRGHSLDVFQSHLDRRVKSMNVMIRRLIKHVRYIPDELTSRDILQINVKNNVIKKINLLLMSRKISSVVSKKCCKCDKMGQPNGVLYYCADHIGDTDSTHSVDVTGDIDNHRLCDYECNGKRSCPYRAISHDGMCARHAEMTSNPIMSSMETPILTCTEGECVDIVCSKALRHGIFKCAAHYDQICSTNSVRCSVITPINRRQCEREICSAAFMAGKRCCDQHWRVKHKRKYVLSDLTTSDRDAIELTFLLATRLDCYDSNIRYQCAFAYYHNVRCCSMVSANCTMLGISYALCPHHFARLLKLTDSIPMPVATSSKESERAVALDDTAMCSYMLESKSQPSDIHSTSELTSLLNAQLESYEREYTYKCAFTLSSKSRCNKRVEQDCKVQEKFYSLCPFHIYRLRSILDSEGPTLASAEIQPIRIRRNAKRNTTTNEPSVAIVELALSDLSTDGNPLRIDLSTDAGRAIADRAKRICTVVKPDGTRCRSVVCGRFADAGILVCSRHAKTKRIAL